jgi:hypothetical protein
MTVRTSGIRQPSVWASVVSDHALVLRDWLLGLGFTEDLMIPGEKDGRVPLDIVLDPDRRQCSLEAVGGPSQ